PTEQPFSASFRNSNPVSNDWVLPLLGFHHSPIISKQLLQPTLLNVPVLSGSKLSSALENVRALNLIDSLFQKFFSVARKLL
ncbi:MAG: hypothetical protein ABJA18_11390, partial [bacterium]